MLHKILAAVLRALLFLLTRLEVHGVENIPTEGSCLLATNHLGRLDPVVVFPFIPRDDFSGLVAKKYRKYPPVRWVVDLLGGIWIDQNAADFQALRAAQEYLRAGHLLGIAPEGTRSPTQALIPAKSGVSYLALRAKTPIVPLAITGTERAVRQWTRLRRPRLTVRVGKPFTLPPLDPRDREGSLQRNTDEIMCRIAALLSPAYRGVYADHPRLKALLAEEENAVSQEPARVSNRTGGV